MGKGKCLRYMVEKADGWYKWLLVVLLVRVQEEGRSLGESPLLWFRH
jgi:hypothetical protein